MFNEREELFATLVLEMVRKLKYKFDRTCVRDHIYRPQFHNDVDRLTLETQRLVHNVLNVDALPVRFMGRPPAGIKPTPLPTISRNKAA